MNPSLNTSIPMRVRERNDAIWMHKKKIDRLCPFFLIRIKKFNWIASLTYIFTNFAWLNWWPDGPLVLYKRRVELHSITVSIRQPPPTTTTTTTTTTMNFEIIFMTVMTTMTMLTQAGVYQRPKQYIMTLQEVSKDHQDRGIAQQPIAPIFQMKSNRGGD